MVHSERRVYRKKPPDSGDRVSFRDPVAAFGRSYVPFNGSYAACGHSSAVFCRSYATFNHSYEACGRSSVTFRRSYVSFGGSCAAYRRSYEACCRSHASCRGSYEARGDSYATFPLCGAMRQRSMRQGPNARTNCSFPAENCESERAVTQRRPSNDTQGSLYASVP